MLKRRFLCILIIFSVLVVVLTALNNYAARTTKPIAIAPAAKTRMNVVLLPLDSRPPCTQFVTQLGQVTNIQIITPPPELLDCYKTPAKKTELRNWLKDKVAAADAAIISTDMLVHGGLLASRQNLGTTEDGLAVLQLLEEIHRDNPQVKLYAFNIIPRLLIADSDTTARFQNNMRQYSVLKDQTLTFENPPDLAKLASMEREIPPLVISRYSSLIEANIAFNMNLIDMTERGVLTSLVIGQDDGYPFGLPNMVKHRLTNYISQRSHLAERVYITRGTDEVALTLLGHLAQRTSGYQPKVLVKYSNPAAATAVMPFMPHSVAQTVKEKLDLAGVIPVPSIEQADFILYVHIGTQKTGPGSLSASAREINKLMASGNKVALVDLTEDFYSQETLLPYLLMEGAPIGKLIAYAGWNTTSNSVGTAVTQASLFVLSLAEDHSPNYLIRAYRNNLEFLTARFLDDWYYQKIVEPGLKNYLKGNKIDKYNLADHYPEVNAKVAAIMQEKSRTLYRAGLSGYELIIDTDQGKQHFVISALHTEAELPWPRTFEVKINTALSLATVE